MSDAVIVFLLMLIVTIFTFLSGYFLGKIQKKEGDLPNMNGPSLEKNVHQENKLKPLFSSLSDHWNTPKSLYEKLDQEFHFNYDPCPSSEGLHEFDGFGSWKERNFVNPPYSKVREWINHGYVESLKGKLCVFLVAARTDTAWFHDYVLPFAKEIRFIRGRLRFNDSTDPLKRAPFPSCIIIFDGRQKP